MSSPGSATMVQALEKAVWPVRPISQELTRVTRVPGGPLRLAESAAIRPPAPRADHQHVGVDQHAVELVLTLTTAAGGSSPTDARRRCAPGRKSRS